MLAHPFIEHFGAQVILEDHHDTASASVRTELLGLTLQQLKKRAKRHRINFKVADPEAW